MNYLIVFISLSLLIMKFFTKYFTIAGPVEFIFVFFLQASLVILNSTAFSNVNDSLIKIGLSS